MFTVYKLFSKHLLTVSVYFTISCKRKVNGWSLSQARYSALNAGLRREYVWSCRYHLSINLGIRVMGRKRDKVIKSRRANNQEVEQTECEIPP